VNRHEALKETTKLSQNEKGRVAKDAAFSMNLLSETVEAAILYQ
jgi:hypothetical protein